MQQLGKIFLGATPSDHTKFITEALRHFKSRGFDRVKIPCVGQFTLAHAAIKAGFQPANVETSDITFFSTALGYFYAGKPLSTLEFSIADSCSLLPNTEENPADRYAAAGSEEERLAYILFLIKARQLKTAVYYQRLMLEEMLRNRGTHLQALTKKLVKYREQYAGIQYAPRDMRDVIFEDHDRTTVVIVNPPAYKSGYTKMFPIEGLIGYNMGVEEFDLKKEYFGIFEQTKAMAAPFFWYRQYDLEGLPPEDVVFAKEEKPGKFDFWLLTKPSMLAGSQAMQAIVYRKGKQYKPYKNLPIWDINDEITPDLKVQFIQVQEENALYYRDLFAHRLGVTKAEIYFIILLGGKVFGTVGFHGSDLLRMKTNRIYEVYGFSAPSWRYPNKNRLLMTLITSSDMGKTLRACMSKKNRIYDLTGLRTTCITKYRKNKLNNGLLNIIKREKLDSGMYKLQYDIDFREETFQQSLVKYLREWEEVYKDKITKELGTTMAMEG